MTSKRALLPHQLAAFDDRSSYIQRVQTLAGPGAYPIPSTFKQPATLNVTLHDVHEQHYGREFARKQRQQSDSSAECGPPDAARNTGAQPDESNRRVRDKYRERRERLRALLRCSSLDNWQQQHATSPPTGSTTGVIGDASCSQPPSQPSPGSYDAFVDGYRPRSDSTTGVCAQVALLEQQHLAAPVAPSSVSLSLALDEIELSLDCAFESLPHSPLPPSLHAPVQADEKPRSAPAAARAPTSPIPASPVSPVGSVASTTAMTPLSYEQFLSTTSYARQREQQHRKSPAKATRNSTGNRSAVVVVDVRDPGTDGGFVRGALNVPKVKFDSDDFLDAFVREHAGDELLVFHCVSSNGRGPTAAGRVYDRVAELLAHADAKPVVKVLRGGIKAFKEQFADDETLVDPSALPQ